MNAVLIFNYKTNCSVCKLRESLLFFLVLVLTEKKLQYCPIHLFSLPYVSLSNSQQIINPKIMPPSFYRQMHP